jgi:hypothetical protein
VLMVRLDALADAEPIAAQGPDLLAATI